MLTIDGNEAAARVAHLTNEVIAIYPITPASPMGEWADEWSSKGVKNVFGSVPEIIEMQSEGGAAGAIHGALQAGSLATTFTASQGLLLMLPNMYKIAGELSPMVLHVSARSLAAQALSIFCDHSDVMSARMTGFGILCSNSVQEAQDLAMVAQIATLRSRIPFIHMFDGFRTSHEISRIEELSPEQIHDLLPHAEIHAHRSRSMSPDHPVVRGTSQNPDVYFQGRETVNNFYAATPGIMQEAMDEFAKATGRAYKLYEYTGAEDAERLIVIMGSAAGTTEETVEQLISDGEKVAVLKVRLYRPFDASTFVDTIPTSISKIAVLDRTKEPGSDGEPLYKDVMTALATSLADGKRDSMPRIIGGRYGLSSKEFTPGMVKAVFDELNNDQPKNHFTIGIHDDLSNTSLEWDADYRVDSSNDVVSAVFYGLGSDGTVSANKNSIKIISDHTGKHVQGYFQYDSKKSGAVTVSHLRFSPNPIRSAYLVQENEASFVACHQPIFLERYPLLDLAKPGAVFLLNSSAPADQVWNTLPKSLQQVMIDKQIEFYVIDAYAVAQEAGMGRRINTVMQACFFEITGILPKEEAIEQMKAAVKKTYGRKGRRLLERNFKAIDMAVSHLAKVAIPGSATSAFERAEAVPANSPEFVQKVTGTLIAGLGDQLPVSLMPNDGTFPVGTAAWEKRNIALEIPVWESDLCTHCGKCPFVCPHAAIRSKVFPESDTANAPESFKHVKVKGKDFPDGYHISYQVAPEDCTGCGLCVEVCPIRDKKNPERKALNMAPQPPLRTQERDNWDFFHHLPSYDRRSIKPLTMKGSMLFDPLFEFSGACVGCGETPYVKLASQLFGDRMLVANATGCSSIYGGNLPTTPWTTDSHGRGPTWSNSLFEDNAEFGLGFRLSVDQHMHYAETLLERLPEIPVELKNELISANQTNEAEIHEQRERVAQLQEILAGLDNPLADALKEVADYLVKKSVWLMGGDGWAYDIGYGGLDHVLSSGRNVNVLVMDTEVYSNTGGQTSKATPRGAVAKFSAAGKPGGKKDLALMAMSYGNVYVAQVAFGAKDTLTLRAFLEAESWDGPSLIIAYSPCIAHGIDLAHNLQHQDLAVRSGHWPLFRYDPRRAEAGEHPLKFDSKAPSEAYQEFMAAETRFSMLSRTHPEEAEKLARAAQQDVKARYNLYQQLAGMHVGADKPKSDKEA